MLHRTFVSRGHDESHRENRKSGTSHERGSAPPRRFPTFPLAATFAYNNSREARGEAGRGKEEAEEICSSPTVSPGLQVSRSSRYTTPNLLPDNKGVSRGNTGATCSSSAAQFQTASSQSPTDGLGRSPKELAWSCLGQTSRYQQQLVEIGKHVDVRGKGCGIGLGWSHVLVSYC